MIEAERLVFGHTIQSMLQVLGKPNAGEVKRLASVGFTYPYQLKPAYSIDEFDQLLHLVGELRWPALTAEERDFEVGVNFIKAFQSTLIGSAMFSLLRLMGPRRALQRMARNLRSATNYVEAIVVLDEEGRMEIACQPVFRKNYYLGFLTQAFVPEGEGRQLKLVRDDDHRVIFEFSWRR